MKIAVINFSGNVGKSTVARHLLLPRLPGATLIAVESVNAGEGQAQSLRGRQFGELQEYLLTVDSAVVDIGASNVEEFLTLMHKYQGSHEDFDCFVVPTVPALKQQQDTIATLVELAGLGVPPARLKLVFNMVDDGVELRQAFDPLLAFTSERPIAHANTDCRLGKNEIYARIRDTGRQVSELARDETDYKSLIVRAQGRTEKLALAQELATQRLARGVLAELEACFAALVLKADNCREQVS